MKKIIFAVVFMSLFATTASAVIVPVNLTLDAPTSEINTMESTITLFAASLGIPGENGVAVGNSTVTTPSGKNTKINLGIHFNNLTHEVMGISSIEFIRQENVGPIAVTDSNFTVVFPGILNVPVQFISVGANVDTVVDSSAVTSGAFPGTEQRMYIDKGILRLEFPSPTGTIDWDFSVPGYAAFDEMDDPCSVAVSLAGVSGGVATYDVDIEVPIDFHSEIWVGTGAQAGDYTATGLLKWSGQISRTAPLPGDADENGTVNDLDAAEVAKYWLTGPSATWGQGDFNYDGWVNDADAALMAANWGKTAGGQTAVPEPAVAVILLWTALAALAIRRIR